MAASSKRVIYAALIGNSLIAVTKFIASAVTGSSAMLTEGIHSLVDTGNQVLLLHGLRRSRRPADAAFPFGHGKEVYFWSFVVAILIFALGSGISLYEGILHVMHPGEVTNPLVNYIVLGLAIAFETGAFLVAAREFSHARGDRGVLEAIRHGKDPTLFVVLFEDGAALLGLFAALVGVGLTHYTGDAVFDGIASIVIGVILGATAIWLALETKGLLIGESAEPAVVQGIREILEEREEVLHVNELLTMHLGPRSILVNV
ncbi:MAG: cation diffusion facilitator family transporter, partial [Candidatus Latescibacteria bacterium]|nr:cation diffusion facilitator family transporter [Candidatus Latescibacterota bacterium]